MKAALQLVTSLIAAGGLLGSVASQATGLSELPLKASVLAKPNVVFGMDDSGSMDWELLLNTYQGVASWNTTTNTLWTSAGKPSSVTFSTPSLQYFYLFPVGAASGGQIVDTSNAYGRVAPPIAQVAGLRSSFYNPIYYDTGVTYKPWSPAYVNGSMKTSYPAATPTAAKAHPEVSSPPTLDLTTAWDSSKTNFADDLYAFRVHSGMVLPAGTSVNATAASGGSACSGSTRRTLTADTTAVASCTARIPYFPATFWHPTVCPTSATGCVAAPDCTVSTAADSACVWAPGSTTVKLRRYEIKTGNTFPSGRSVTNEMQNFANWFTYHRKRKLMLAGSMGRVLENITGLRMGVAGFNESSPPITMYDGDSTDNTKNRFTTAGRFYNNAMSLVATPTLKTIKTIGDKFGSDTNIVQYACQRNNMFVVTDGLATDVADVTAPTYTSATYGTGAPYQTTYAKTQADLALAYYTNRLRATGTGALPAGRVPVSTSTDPAADKNPDLHINFYAISLGVTGSLWSPTANPYTTSPSWTMPADSDPSTLDDLWHATINGRGKFYLATTPTETAASIQAGLNDILNGTGAQGGVSVSTVNLSRGDGFAYMGRYNPAGWAGDLTANAINASTGAISTTSTWSASAKLLARDWSTRVIASYSGSAGVAFTAGGVGSAVNPSSAWGDSTEVLNYLRGDRSHESDKFRSRTSLMGAVINAEPVISREDDVVYVASGEGMLHAFDIRAGTGVGQELWAYVPRAVLADIGQTSSRGYSFKTQLDGTPVIGKTGSSSKLLVAGMGAAGRSYYALDASSPRSRSETDLSWVKWEFPSPSETTTVAKVGQTVGKPAIVRLSDGSYRVLVTSGYNSTADGKGRLFVLDPSTGTVSKEFVTTDGSLTTESGLAHITPYAEDDGSVRYVYGGDLLGNLYRFDLSAATGTAPNIVAVLKDASGNRQPVTAPPEVAAVAGKRLVLVGTGRLLDVTDWGKTATQTFYAITDGATIDSARTSLVQQTFTRSTDTLTSNPVNWSSDRGWYMDLPSGENANTRPTIAYGAVAFTTNITGASDCTASSYFYVIDVATGGKSAGVDFVSSTVSTTANASGATAVVTTGTTPPDGGGGGGGSGGCESVVRALMQTADGQPVEKNLDCKSKVDPSKNSWREVRQR